MLTLVELGAVQSILPESLAKCRASTNAQLFLKKQRSYCLSLVVLKFQSSNIYVALRQLGCKKAVSPAPIPQNTF